MLTHEYYVKALVAERHKQAHDAALRAQIYAARRSRRRKQDTSRWIRRLLLVTR
jgi:hypothetical protein